MTRAEFAREVNAIVAREATQRSDLASAASVIANIAEQIGGDA